jgi:hypothetical protein
MPIMMFNGLVGALLLNGLCAFILAIATIGGYFSPTQSFGQWLAPYTLAGTIALLIPIAVASLSRLPQADRLNRSLDNVSRAFENAGKRSE